MSFLLAETLMHEIPDDLIFNWDQLALYNVQVSGQCIRPKQR